MKKELQELQVKEYRIRFYYNDSPSYVQERHFQATDLEQVKSNLNKIIEDDEYGLISIESYNRYSEKWDIADE